MPESVDALVSQCQGIAAALTLELTEQQGRPQGRVWWQILTAAKGSWLRPHQPKPGGWMGELIALPMTSLLCCYRNIGNNLLILRCCGPGNFFLERLVFPFELLTFSCPADAEVKIWHWDDGGPTLIDCCLAEAMLCGD